LDDATPLISVNAITSIAAVKTMKLLVHIQDTVVTTLVDSSSTHSFVAGHCLSPPPRAPILAQPLGDYGEW
jgi:hypothetical protein